MLKKGLSSIILASVVCIGMTHALAAETVFPPSAPTADSPDSLCARNPNTTASARDTREPQSPPQWDSPPRATLATARNT